MDRTNSGESEQKSEVSNTNKTPSPSPPPKPDYIHVRARRGQATDSHSLAERVRREKIGQRMKYLQDLVPGCTKVTGKAMMLDEIINYVQSLQRQVEFLSMKLASVPPSKLDFNFESLFGKEMTRSQPPLQHGCDSPRLVGPPLQSRQPLNPSPFFQQVAQVHQQHLPIYGESTCTPLTSAMLQNSLVSDSFPRRTFNMLALVPSSENFGECIPQIQDAWVDDDLVPLAGYAQALNMHSSLQGASSHGQMKTEL
ncbi:hypothetical protein KP509_16G026700 [Ceratopteris richardii]|nr:hypothetical protein KP509_16G026700 [Ceratopteris richardii]